MPFASIWLERKLQKFDEENNQNVFSYIYMYFDCSRFKTHISLLFIFHIMEIFKYDLVSIQIFLNFLDFLTNRAFYSFLK